jgi:dTDP-4-amino-4,6-dideoxygalactose transaminase
VKVPFVDLKRLHHEIGDELRLAFARVLENSSFILGPEVERFEAEFARYCGAEHCVALNNGTSAIHSVLVSLGIGPGDEVITVPHTFIATAEAISAVGATPVFIDIDPISYCMNPELIEPAITKKTRAIMPVHLYGQMADMGAILEVANAHNMPVIEDACQAHGAEYDLRRAGSLGFASCFSFYPGKNLGACGEGGAVTTNDADLAQRLRLWRDHGSQRKYEHMFPGHNMRMEGIQGAILTVKLKYLHQWNDLRRQAARYYAQVLHESQLILPQEMPRCKHVYHLYVVCVDDRDGLRDQLGKLGVESGLHYPTPLHLQPAYSHLDYQRGDFPVTEFVASRVLSLPMYPGISTEAIDHVAAAMLEICNVA